MELESIHVIRRRSDGAILATVGRPRMDLLEEADEIASAYRPSNIGATQVYLALCQMLADLSIALVDWVRKNPDKPLVIIDK